MKSCWCFHSCGFIIYIIVYIIYISFVSTVYIITHNSLNFRGKSVHYGWNLPPLLFKNMLSSFDLQFSYLLVHSVKFSFILSLLLWIIFTLEVFLPFSKQTHFFFKLTIILSWTQYCLNTQARRAFSLGFNTKKVIHHTNIIQAHGNMEWYLEGFSDTVLSILE